MHDYLIVDLQPSFSTLLLTLKLSAFKCFAIYSSLSDLLILDNHSPYKDHFNLSFFHY